MSTVPADFAEFAAARHSHLLRAAYLLTGDRDSAQDLTQETLIRLLTAWPRVRAADDPFAYSRRTMLNLYLRSRRRRWHGERPQVVLPEVAAPDDHARADQRDVLRRALATLPARQRAAVVLRQFEDLSEADTAAVMRCSIGTVKSLTSRGLAALRMQLAPTQEARR